MKVSYGFSSLFFQLCFRCSSLSKNHPDAFPLKLTLQGIEVSFPGNSGLDGSHSSNEPPWRRLPDVSSQLRFPGMHIKPLGQGDEVMGYFLIAVQGQFNVFFLSLLS